MTPSVHKCAASVAAVAPAKRVDEALPLVREVLTLLNANANSVLPRVARDVLDRWIRGHTAQSPLVAAMIRSAGAAVTRPEALAPLLEALLLAHFCDDEDEVGDLGERVRGGAMMIDKTCAALVDIQCHYSVLFFCPSITGPTARTTIDYPDYYRVSSKFSDTLPGPDWRSEHFEETFDRILRPM